MLLKLGFVSPVALESEQTMVAELWGAMGGDEGGANSVPVGNCKNVLRAI